MKHIRSWCVILCVILLYIPLTAKNPVEIHGFVSQGYLQSNTYNLISNSSTDGTWEYREVGLNVQKGLGNRVHVGIQLLSRDVGEYGNNKVVLDWAYGSFYVHDLLSVSAGRVKAPTGFYGEIQDFDFLYPWVILPSAMYNKGLRTLTSTVDGLGFNGNINLKSAGSIDYKLLLGYLDLGPESDVQAYAEQQGVNGVESVGLNFKGVANVVYNTPIDGLSLNFTYNHTNEADFTFTIDGGSINRVMDMNWFYWGAKYSHMYFDVVGEYYTTYSPFSMKVYIDGFGLYSEKDTISRGGGGYLGLNVKPFNWLSVASYYQMYWDYYDPSSIDYDYGVNDSENINRDLAFTVGFNIKDHVVIKGEAHTVKGLALLSESEKQKDLGDTYQYGVVKVSFNF